ncbi:MAG TPA: hypothetical protein PLX60_09090 [Chitinophagales bacterium]|nr:hypothetical protein [Chitinophagales bacterium]
MSELGFIGWMDYWIFPRLCHSDEGGILLIIKTNCGLLVENQQRQRRTNRNQLENEVHYLRSVYEYFSGSNVPSDKELIKSINKVKNELKHNDSGDNEWFNADFENEAVLLFVKAVKNYHDCYKEFPNDRIIKNLFEHLTS